MTEDRGGLHSVVDAIGGLLSNPVVLEGLIAGISAVSASRRTKSSGGGDATASAGGILDMLPGMLPLLSVFMSSGAESGGTRNDGAGETSAADTAPVPAEAVDAVLASAGEQDTATPPNAPDAADDGDLSGLFPEPGDAQSAFADVSYESRESQRENLLLAIRPFLSESRRSAADAMVQVNRLSGMFRQR